MYEKGLGVEQNYSKDFEYYNKAANLGEPLAFNNLGVLYENGYGFEQDFSNAIEFYEKAVDFDCLNAKDNLNSFKHRTKNKKITISKK